MRVLCTFVGGTGHLKPLLPFARALDAAGHDVAIAGQNAALSDAGAGFTVFRSAAEAEGFAEPRPITPLVPPDLDHEYEVIRRYYAGTAAAKSAERTLGLIRSWKPDLVLCDEMNFGAMIAAERARIPRAIVNVIASGALVRRDDVAEPLERLRGAHGLPADAELRMLSRDVLISPCPPSFRDPEHPLPEGAISVRPEAGSDAMVGFAESDAIGWLAASDRPRVYFTLGTVFNSESGDLFRRVIAGLAGVHARALVTVGSDLDQAQFDGLAPNVRVERYVEQSIVLEHCDLVINHGGSGSVMGALSRGIPLVLLPMGADQELNADRVAALRAGLVLDPVSLTPERLQSAVTEAFSSPDLRAACGRLRDEIRSLPEVASVVPLLERLAGEGCTRG
jgi:UDP:flavonoid glycosyltransferase YjiC (YdhE family)